MDVNVDNLISKTGVDKELAELLLDFTNNDVDGAVKIIGAMPKDYSVLKMRFICQKTHYYGVAFLLINLKNKTIEETQVLLDRDKRASAIDNLLTFDIFYNDILKYKSDKQSESDIEKRILDDFKTEEFKENLLGCYNAKNNKFDLNQVKSVMDDLFFRTLTETDIVIKIQEEKIDVFKYKKFRGMPLFTKKIEDIKKAEEEKAPEEKKGREYLKDKTEEKQETTVKVHNISLVLLKVEPIVSPVKGIAVSELQIGDPVKVKIIDDRDIGSYLNNLLGGITETGDIKEVIANVKSIEKNLDTDNYNVVVEFGPGIGGVMNLAGEIKILTPISEELDKINKTFNINTGIWIGVMLLIILFILFFLITVT